MNTKNTLSFTFQTEYDESGGEEEEEDAAGSPKNDEDNSDNEIDANLNKDKATEENNEKHANEVIEENEAPTCGPDGSGCDHECHIQHRKVVCSCREGFELDEADGKTCHGE